MIFTIAYILCAILVLVFGFADLYHSTMKAGRYTLSGLCSGGFWVLFLALAPLLNFFIAAFILIYSIAEAEFMKETRYIGEPKDKE